MHSPPVDGALLLAFVVKWLKLGSQETKYSTGVCLRFQLLSSNEKPCNAPSLLSPTTAPTSALFHPRPHTPHIRTSPRRLILPRSERKDAITAVGRLSARCLMSAAFKATCQSSLSEGLFFNRTHTSVAGRGGEIAYSWFIPRTRRALAMSGSLCRRGEAFMHVKRTMVSWQRMRSAVSTAATLMQWAVSKAPRCGSLCRVWGKLRLKGCFGAWTCITWCKGYGTKSVEERMKYHNILSPIDAMLHTERFKCCGFVCLSHWSSKWLPHKPNSKTYGKG